MKCYLKLAVLALPLWFVPAANAEMVVSLGYALVGGDNLVETTGEDLDAGAGFTGDIGFLKRPEGSDFSYQGTIGFKADFVDFDGGDADTFSIPLHLLAFYNTGNARFGGGIVYEIGPEYSLNAPGLTSNVDFDDALGVVIEWDYFYSSSGFWGVKFSSIDYDVPSGQALVSTSSGATVTSIDANNFALHVGFLF